MTDQTMRCLPPVDHMAKALAGSAGVPPGLSPAQTASILFLIQFPWGRFEDPVLLLNKRSVWVRQAGDLCCPGGRVREHLDRILGFFLKMPGTSLARSRGWKRLSGAGTISRGDLAMYWACCLRESWEEMRLFPCGVEFLGILPLYRLMAFDRRILPLVGWISGYDEFRPNWEVEKIVSIPFSSLLNSANYAVLVLSRDENPPKLLDGGPNEHPCYVHTDDRGREILWGATYHVVVSFLERVCNFSPPPMETRPLIRGRLSVDYLTGRPARAR